MFRNLASQLRLLAYHSQHSKNTDVYLAHTSQVVINSNMGMVSRTKRTMICSSELLGCSDASLLMHVHCMFFDIVGSFGEDFPLVL